MSTSTTERHVPGGSIVVGVDETALAGQAVRWAAEQAALEHRPLALVHASGPITAVWGEYAMNVPATAFAELRRAGEEVLARAAAVAADVAPEVAVTQVYDVGEARVVLTDISRDARLVVLGSRGRGPALSHLLGSVGQDVLRRAACPVVVHRPSHPGLVHSGVVAAVEASEEAQPVLEVAYRLASQRGWPLRVLHHVWDPRSALVGAPMVGDLDEERAADEIRVAEAMAGFGERYPDVRTSVVVTPGLPERDLATAAQRADLLVLGSRQRGVGSRLLMGSVAVAVLERATCPVAVVPVGAPVGAP